MEGTVIVSRKLCQRPFVLWHWAADRSITVISTLVSRGERICEKEGFSI